MREKSTGTSHKPNYVAFYGSLMRGNPPCLGAQKNIPIDEKIKHIGTCSISGFLYDLGNYPGLVETHLKQDIPLVQAELYEILDDHAIELLDEYEGFYPRTPNASYYLRKQVELETPVLTAWCYFYNESVDGKQLIESGCWRSHLKSTCREQQ